MICNIIFILFFTIIFKILSRRIHNTHYFELSDTPASRRSKCFRARRMFSVVAAGLTFLSDTTTRIAVLLVNISTNAEKLEFLTTME